MTDEARYSIIHRLSSSHSTIKTKMIGDFYKTHGHILLATPVGKEKRIFEKGQRVVSTGEGVVKGGVEMTIQNVMNNNGFYRYYALGQWHNQEDVEVIK